jgi:hypothetical protein
MTKETAPLIGGVFIGVKNGYPDEKIFQYVGCIHSIYNSDVVF